MPDRWARRCSTVTSSSISGRSAPSTDRAVVVEVERAVFDQAHHRERGQALRAARDAEPGVDRVRDLVAAIRQSVGLRELDGAGPVDTHDAGEPRLVGDRVDRLL